MTSKYSYHKESISQGFLNDVKYLMKKNCVKESKFVIFGRGRSGSTLLVSLLNTLPGMYCDGEVFNIRSIIPKARLRRACDNASSSIYGFKLLSYQLFRYSDSYQKNFLDYLIKTGFRIIYLKRDNILMHAISNIRAREYGFHHKLLEKNIVKKIKIDKKELFYWLELSEMRELKEELLLSGVEHYNLIYEKNLENPDRHKATVDGVCDYLGIDRGWVATQYRKVSPEKLIDSIENYQDLKDILNKTRYEKYLIS
jgi:LPS sulfotransferase NodH